MLPKRYRLNRSEYQRAWKMGTFFSTPKIGAKILATPGRLTRFGFSVGVKYSRLATERNRARRVLQESIRQSLPRLKPGYLIVLFFLRSKKEISDQDIPRSVELLIAKTKLLK